MNNNDKYNLFWTICWLVFTGLICFMFNSPKLLWFLVIWFFGLKKY